MRRRHPEQAEVMLQTIVDHPQCPADALLMAADLASDRGDFQAARSLLETLASRSETESLLAKQRLASICHHKLFLLTQAERWYTAVLDQDSSNSDAHDGLAHLLAACGRTREAVPHVIALIQAGIETDLVVLLSRETGGLNEPDLLDKAAEADPDDPLPTLGKASMAIMQQDSQTAIDLLKQITGRADCPRIAQGLLGQQWLTVADEAALQKWAFQFDPEVATCEEWLVAAELCPDDQPLMVARCLWEALRKQPERRSATQKLARTLRQLNRLQQAEQLEGRLRRLNRLRDIQQNTIFARQQPPVERLFELVESYHSVGRFWEAVAWGRIAAEYAPADGSVHEILRQIQSRQGSLPRKLTDLNATCLAEIDLSDLPLPNLNQSSTTSQTNSATLSDDLQFSVADAKIGFDFQYHFGTSSPNFRMYELPGGGLGVIDIDQDNWPDLLCTQGGPWAQRNNPELTDVLLRNQRGQSFRRQAIHGCKDKGFGHGVAVGDLNHDGFADVLIANAGHNQLLLNNGDGTFSESELPAQSAWTLSCVVADLNNDGLPDLYEVNYLDGDRLFERICKGSEGGTEQCPPYEFKAAVDRLLINDGQGGFVDQTKQLMDPLPAGKGMGVVLLQTENGPSLFVSNDTTANFFYVSDADGHWTDQALLSGVAFGTDGRAEACMGIAAADATGDGRTDLHVTNFLNESNTLYVAEDAGLFVDQIRTTRLEQPSLGVLGFGCQFLDANLDGRQELFVTNGYTHDQSSVGIPYQMPPQLYEWTGSEFARHSVETAGTWLDEKYVGRSVCRWDWNQDGQPDLSVGRLHQPTQLLTNTSETRNCWLSLNLIGTKSDRDAVGAKVEVRCGQHTQTFFVMAGDGYQCSNQKTIFVGCGNEKTANVKITWPSADVSEEFKLPTNQTYSVIEDRAVLKSVR